MKCNLHRREKTEKKIIKFSEQELKNMKGSTNWAALVVKDKKRLNNKIQRTQKTHR